MKNEPNEIYLQIGENADESFDNEINDFDDLVSEALTWCRDKINDSDILYYHHRYTPFCTKTGESLHIGDRVRMWLENSAQLSGGYWWYATIEFHCGCLVLWEIGFDSYGMDENFPTLLHKEIENIELCFKYYEWRT